MKEINQSLSNSLPQKSALDQYPMWPNSAAAWMASWSQSWLQAMLGSAPWSSRKSTHAWWPSWEAISSGVARSAAWVFASAPTVKTKSFCLKQLLVLERREVRGQSDYRYQHKDTEKNRCLPAFTRISRLSCCPYCAAKNRGEILWSSSASKLHTFTSIRTISLWPWGNKKSTC